MEEITIEKIRERILSHLETATSDDISIFANKINEIACEGMSSPDWNSNELLVYLFSLKPGSLFLGETYEKILQRSPDERGYAHYLTRLNYGMPKSIILYQIINSEEAKSKKVDIKISPHIILKIKMLIFEEKFVKWGLENKSWIKRIPLISTFVPSIYVSLLQHKMAVINEKRCDENIPSIGFIKIPSTISNFFLWIYGVLLFPLFVYQLVQNNRKLKSEIESIRRNEISQLVADSLSLKAEIQAMRGNELSQLIQDYLKLKAEVQAMRGNELPQLIQENQNLKAEIQAIRGNELTQLIQDCMSLKADIKAIRENDIKPIVTAGNDVVITKVEGFLMALPGEDIALIAYLTFYGSLELGQTKTFRSRVKAGMVVVDIGASVGIYTLIAASLVGESGKVYSFEPTPRTFDLLTKNIEMNGFSKIVDAKRIAVTDRNGKGTLSIYKDCLGHNTLFQNPGDQDLLEVETTCLDTALGAERKIDIVKIDAEGAEPYILRGMKNLIKQNPQMNIFMEFAPVHIHRAGINVEDFINEIHEYGFNFQRIDDLTGELHPVSRKELLESYSFNLLLNLNDPKGDSP